MQEQSCQASVDMSRVAAIAARYKDEPDQLMRILLEIQSCCGNSIPREAATVISSITGIPEAKIWGYITFYAMFSDKPRGKHIIRMCKSAPCHVRGAREVVDAICDLLQLQIGETSEDGRFTLEYCPCLGLCENSPAIMINDRAYSNLTPEKARDIIKQYIREEV